MQRSKNAFKRLVEAHPHVTRVELSVKELLKQIQ